jgi:hypothetical protein
MSAIIEVLLLLLAWVAIFGLLIVVPWIVVRMVVGLLEVDVESRVKKYRSPTHDRPEGFTTTKSADGDPRPDEPEPEGQGRS